jgi:hypothetical protein
MSTVTVFGATGYTGRAITTELLSRGRSVVAVARSVSGLAAQPNLTAISGSIHSPKVVAEACKGADVVLVALPGRVADGPSLLDALPNLVLIAVDVGARLGFMGGAGTLRAAPDNPMLFEAPEFPSEYMTEVLAHKSILDALRGSRAGLDWFYISPALDYGAWNPGERTGRYRTSGDILLTDNDGNSTISAADLAIAFADEIERPAHHRERFHVAN